MKSVMYLYFSLILFGFCAHSHGFDAIKSIGKSFVRSRIDHVKESLKQKVQQSPLLSTVTNLLGTDLQNDLSNGDLPNNPLKTQFADMNEDCRVLILEQLDFGGLLNVAQINREFSQMSAYVFRRKYSNRRIAISDNFGVTNETTTHIEMIREIGLRGHETVINTFKYFGHVISKLKLTYSSFKHYRAELLGELISNYSSESLEEVILEYCTNNTLELIQKPLVNVKIVQFKRDFYGFGDKGLVISDLFPSVQFLYLDGHFTSVDYFDTHMKHLQHLCIGIMANSLYNAFNSRGNFETVITKNPQIRSIALFNTPSAYIRVVNSLLPHLENITLWHPFQLKKPVRFENVTTFKVHPVSSSPSNLQMPKLRNLFITLRPRLVDEWQRFLREHQNVTKFHWKNVDDMNDETFDQIASELSNIVEMAVQLQSGSISAGCIKDFLESHGKLIEFHLILGDVAQRDSLREELGWVEIEWNIENIFRGISFRRK